MKLSVRKPACESLKWNMNGSNMCRNYGSKFASFVPRRLRDCQKHISKVERFLRKPVNKGMKALFFPAKIPSIFRVGNLLCPVRILICRNIYVCNERS